MLIMAGNFMAIGSMTPKIDIWDLDIINTMEPVVTLGGTREKKAKKVWYLILPFCS